MGWGLGLGSMRRVRTLLLGAEARARFTERTWLGLVGV